MYITKGNHDKFNYSKIDPRIETSKYFIYDINGKLYLFSHFPTMITKDWVKKYSDDINELSKIFIDKHCDYHVHGHSHGQQFHDHFINVCIHVLHEPKKLIDIVKK